MKSFVLGSAVLLLASATASASYLGVALSSQYQAHDGIGGYSYGYAEPNSQKHETKDAHGITHGGYSYVDANGHVQSVKYTADPIHGFQVSGTNLPKGPAPHAVAVPAWNAYAYAPVVLGHNGAPIETPEVQAAKAAHFAAHAAAKARLHKRSLYAPWTYAAAAPVVLGHNGVPLDTPEVAHAKAEHAAAHAKALGYGHAAAGPIPDTPEVAHAKAAHAAAHAAARANHHAVAPVTVAHAVHAVGHAAHYPQHIPVIKNGVPVETPEVQHAKAAHYAAVAEASARAGSGAWAPAGHEDDGSYDGRWDNHY
ncbi:cuticle protein 18.7 isoform X2 [Anopheles maculipalpis]|uniref:cuticle protein 18.7 isoform X2 n=1 Tax=Anopheles maculipalpis TaxID=1496333 RepID=UPI00215907FF|nr:cuticle protein 18.7 isoform X2 [Anopheles maculipalpis]